MSDRQRLHAIRLKIENSPGSRPAAELTEGGQIGVLAGGRRGTRIAGRSGSGCNPGNAGAALKIGAGMPDRQRLCAIGLEVKARPGFRPAVELADRGQLRSLAWGWRNTEVRARSGSRRKPCDATTALKIAARTSDHDRLHPVRLEIERGPSLRTAVELADRCQIRVWSRHGTQHGACNGTGADPSNTGAALKISARMSDRKRLHAIGLKIEDRPGSRPADELADRGQPRAVMILCSRRYGMTNR